MDVLSQLFSWFGDHWWIVFPLMGVAGGVAGRWQAISRQRHKQRLETLRLKSELKAAELAARGQVAPVAPSTRPVSSKELLERLFAEHDEITARWLDYELDVAKVIAFPAMSDGRQPLTAAFLRARKTADTLRPTSAEARVSEQQVAEYLDAVGAYAVAFEVAEKDARRVRDSGFTEGERKRLDRAQHMLKVAVDESATAAERQTAYRRVREELDGLIDLSDAAVEHLEKKVALQLEPSAAGSTSGPAAPATTAAASAAPSAVEEPAPAPQPQADPLRRTEG